MPRKTVDLTRHLNQTIERGHAADFPVALMPLYYSTPHAFEEVPNRVAVVREDTGQVLSVVSDRYSLVPHQEILDLVEQATAPLDLGPIPRGIYVDRQGARMRALFKFPALARPVLREDDICPCLKIQNTYDGSSRIALHIGAFRFVCTNLAVGGGGAFAGGFMSIHTGEIPLEQVAEQLSAYLSGFEAIVELYRYWAFQPMRREAVQEILETLPKRTCETIWKRTEENGAKTVYDAYNVATYHATHRMRSYRTAFDLLERINCGFQNYFPLSEA